MGFGDALDPQGAKQVRDHLGRRAGRHGIRDQGRDGLLDVPLKRARTATRNALGPGFQIQVPGESGDDVAEPLGAGLCKQAEEPGPDVRGAAASRVALAARRRLCCNRFGHRSALDCHWTSAPHSGRRRRRRSGPVRDAGPNERFSPSSKLPECGGRPRA